MALLDIVASQASRSFRRSTADSSVELQEWNRRHCRIESMIHHVWVVPFVGTSIKIAPVTAAQAARLSELELAAWAAELQTAWGARG
ncbi:hypothetical protein GCM10010170_024540 [Dactylosporangium salmoneum]|uniref:Uncharacterized protein n=1 Tax=Dactylosporangium salmoneum TaxID=53361 RepID=A0ABN3G186_9ACTN